MTRPRGGYIGFNRVPAASGVNSAASGIWTLREAESLKRAGAWPTPPPPTTVTLLSGAQALSGLGTQQSPYVVVAASPSGDGPTSILQGPIFQVTGGPQTINLIVSDLGPDRRARLRSGATAAAIQGSSTAGSLLLDNINNGAFSATLSNGFFRYALYDQGSETPSLPLGLQIWFSNYTIPTPTYPAAYVYLSTGSFVVPDGATTMKIWAVGGGGSANDDDPTIRSGTGAICYKTFAVTAGTTATMSVPPNSNSWGGTAENTTLTYGATTVFAQSCRGGDDNTAATFGGGDGGLSGQPTRTGLGSGALGLNSDLGAATKHIPREFEGLLAAVALAQAQNNIQRVRMPTTVGLYLGDFVSTANFGYGQVSDGAPYGPGGGKGSHYWAGSHFKTSGAVVVLFT